MFGYKNDLGYRPSTLYRYMTRLPSIGTCCERYPIEKYMLEELNKNKVYVDITFDISETEEYHGWGYLSQPSTIIYNLNGLDHYINIDCKLGDIINKWAAPLYISNIMYSNENSLIDKPILFFCRDDDDERRGNVKCPHIVIDNEGNYVRDFGLSLKQKRELEKFMNYESINDSEQKCFFQRFLEKLPLEVRIRHILSYIPSLHVSSGK
jgi:hypothetical protein